MWLLRRTIRLICPACGRQAKLAAGLVRARAAELCPHPDQPSALEFPWCHPEQTAPLDRKDLPGKTPTKTASSATTTARSFCPGNCST